MTETTLINKVYDIAQCYDPDVDDTTSFQDIVQDVFQLLHSLIKQHNVRAEMRFPDGGADVLVSRIEIEQVMFNLLKNSIDSEVDSI